MPPQKIDADVLRTLHRIHRQLGDLQGRLDRGPRKIKAVNAHVEHLETLLAKEVDAARTVRMAADTKQVQLKGGETRIEELQGKLNTAASNREYQALKDQIAAQKMANSVLEDEILEKFDKIDSAQAVVTASEQTLKQAQDRAALVCKEVTEDEPLICGDITRLKGELEETETQIPTDMRDGYIRVVRQMGEDALAVINSQCCSGCNRNMPLNDVAEVMLGHPMFCRACGRLLYVPEGDNIIL